MTSREPNQKQPVPEEGEATILGPWSRRSFLTAAGIGGAAAAALAATGGVSTAGAAVASKVRSQATPTTTASAATGDAKTVSFAAGLEVLAVATYKAALDAATAGKLGAIPPAGATYVQTAMAQHQAQLDKLNSVLTSTGGTAVTTPDPKLKSVVDTEFAKVTDFVGAAKLARTLEQTAAATYLKAIPTLESKDARLLAGSIQIIDAQHVAILNYVLGEYPVPDVFAKTDMAASP